MSDRKGQHGTSIGLDFHADTTISVKSSWPKADGYVQSGSVRLDRQAAYSFAAEIMTEIGVLPRDFLDIRGERDRLRADLADANARIAGLLVRVGVLDAALTSISVGSLVTPTCPFCDRWVRLDHHSDCPMVKVDAALTPTALALLDGVP